MLVLQIEQYYKLIQLKNYIKFKYKHIMKNNLNNLIQQTKKLYINQLYKINNKKSYKKMIKMNNLF